MHRGDRAIFLHPGLDVHQDGMATAMTIENLFAGECALHRTTGQHRKLANYNLMIKGIALAAKAAAIRCSNHSDMTSGHSQHFGQGSMNVVRRLSRTPQS